MQSLVDDPRTSRHTVFYRTTIDQNNYQQPGLAQPIVTRSYSRFSASPTPTPIPPSKFMVDRCDFTSLFQCLSKCHVFVALVLLIFGALADYISHVQSTVRLHGVIECCAIYFLLTGVTGICSAASHRRGLIIAFLVMCLHAVFIFVPTAIVASSFDVHFYNHECWGECDWDLLSASLPKDSKCQILCGEHVDPGQRLTMSRLGTDYRINAGIITLSIIELILSVITSVLCAQQIFDFSVIQTGPAITSASYELTPLAAAADK